MTSRAQVSPQPITMSPGMSPTKPVASKSGSYTERAAAARRNTSKVSSPQRLSPNRGPARPHRIPQDPQSRAARALSPLGRAQHAAPAAGTIAGGSAGTGQPAVGLGSMANSVPDASSMGTPSLEKENLRQKMEAIAREAADIQRELDGSAAAPSLRARLNAAAALGRPVPSQEDASPGNDPAAVAAAATDAALAAAAAAAGKPPRPDGSGDPSQAIPGTEAGAIQAEASTGYAGLQGGQGGSAPFAATPARAAMQVCFEHVGTAFCRKL